MTCIHPNFDTRLVNLLVRWLQAGYAHKFEHYAATRASTYV